MKADYAVLEGTDTTTLQAGPGHYPETKLPGQGARSESPGTGRRTERRSG